MNKTLENKNVGHEPTEMKALLRGWESSKMRPLTLPSSFEPDYMNERPKMAAECQLVDDGSGERTLWRVEQKEGMVQVEDKGIYYAEACYVMLYKYGQGRRCRSIVRGNFLINLFEYLKTLDKCACTFFSHKVYCWEGVHSVKVDREAALLAACRLSEETNAQLVKASQGREPPHLLQIYDGKLKILAGRHRDLRRVSSSPPIINSTETMKP